MIKTLNINLGGMAFIIDENAFELLHNYLEDLKHKFSNASEREEILNDIEARIAEMLNQKLAGRKEVISLADVQLVIDTMGRPEDIAGEEPAEPGATGGQSTTTASASAGPVKKRLFRDPDDAKIGGVISGLCHYFGIEDPVWVRIAALILIFFTSGTLILVYILLLVIIPKAQTAAEKLQMKGEPVNINTIEKEIKEAAGRAGESVQNFMKEQNLFERLWDATLSVLRVFFKLFAVADILIAMLLLIIVVGCFFAFYVMGSTQYNAATQLIVDSNSVIRLLSFGVLLFLATPLIALIYLGLKILLGQRSRVRWLKSVLVIAWMAGLVLLLISAFKILTNFGYSGIKKQDTTLMQPSNGALYVQLIDSTGKKLSKDWDEDVVEMVNLAQGSITINGVDWKDMDLIPLGKPSLQLMASENDSFYIQELIDAKGKNKDDALKNAGMVIYSFSQTDTVLNLPATCYINKTSKWRLQKMKIRIAVPEGKKIRFADNIDRWAATVKGDANYDDTYFSNTVWTVDDGKVKCIAGENHKNAGEEMKSSDKQMEKVDKQKQKVRKLMIKVDDKLHKSDKKDSDADKDNNDKDDDDKDF